jgi:hypothetical protein
LGCCGSEYTFIAYHCATVILEINSSLLVGGAVVITVTTLTATLVTAVLLPFSPIVGGLIGEDLALQWEEDAVTRRSSLDFEVSPDFSIFTQEQCECKF